eukprot:1579828-Pyramimonas_sp.AAC.1
MKAGFGAVVVPGRLAPIWETNRGLCRALVGAAAASGPLSLVQGLTSNSPTNIQWMANSPQPILLLRTV